MSLITPIALVLGITLPIVVVFYLLKVRRHDEEISSTFLWNDLIRDLAAHEPLQRLKWNLLLLLQLPLPLNLLPEPWFTILKWLPFQYMAYFPAVVFL